LGDTIFCYRGITPWGICLKKKKIRMTSEKEISYLCFNMFRTIKNTKMLPKESIVICIQTLSREDGKHFLPIVSFCVKLTDADLSDAVNTCRLAA